MQELRNLRLAADLTQTALATLLGRPQSYVAKVEGGERRMDVVEFLAWVEATKGQDSLPVLFASLMAAAPEQQSMQN
jgi:transcriptional regulator with XRE-family HTH domain